MNVGKKGWIYKMVYENKDELLDFCFEQGVDDDICELTGHGEKQDNDISERLNVGDIWKDCITPLTYSMIEDALVFVNTINEQLSKWCSSDKLSKYVYSLNIGYEDENGLRDIRKEYVDLLTGIQCVQSITMKIKDQLIMGLAESWRAQS